jgi:bifunctional UDP-N-acetylglucosamine pyrophosphorylase / glucosamine-1-phosphate N-acetyltransferase
MGRPSLLTVILAAGKGTRMRSSQPKVLHAIASRSMLGHVLATVEQLGSNNTAVVVGPDMDSVRDAALADCPSASLYVQEKQNGTADAVLAARDVLVANDESDVIVLYADTPLITTETLERLRQALDAGAQIAVLGFEAADPSGYGRLLTRADGTVTAIREEKDASPEERQVTLCNSGVMAFRLPGLAQKLAQIGNDNAKSEYYLTDIVGLTVDAGGKAVVVKGDEDEVLGVNDRCQLAMAERIWQDRRRVEVMRGGVTLIAPETVWLAYDTTFGRDIVVEPNVVFGPGVSIGDNVIIRANCHFSGAQVGAAATIGPFARLRPGAILSDDVHIGNFVEVKNTRIGAGSKANHLAYLGDGKIGSGSNIGAGTIFCNYDGFFKHLTEIGDGVFVGSNSALVAPVTIGDGAYVGSGSVITKSVAANSLALERSEQQERPGWAEKFRALMSARKARAKKA